jgi:hypothetical protein
MPLGFDCDQSSTLSLVRDTFSVLSLLRRSLLSQATRRTATVLVSTFGRW